MNGFWNAPLADLYSDGSLKDDIDRDYEPAAAAADHAIISDPTAISRFVLAGNAYFTLRSKKSGARYTYRVAASKDGRVYFVSVLTGSDNENAYSYLGIIRETANGTPFMRTAKSRVAESAPSARAFDWFWRQVSARREMPELEFWHEGRCGRCAHKLTVPESIASGYGSECIGKLGFRAEAA